MWAKKLGSYKPVQRGSMDDLTATITFTFVVRSPCVLKALDDAVTWARMNVILGMSSLGFRER